MSNLYENIKRVTGIDLSVFSDNELVLNMFTEKIINIIDNYKIDTNVFLKSFINNLNKYYNLDFKIVRDVDIKTVEVYDDSVYLPCPPADKPDIYDFIDYHCKCVSVSKENIYLVSNLIDAKMFFASKADELYPDKVINSCIYDNISFKLLDSIQFTDSIKEIFIETYFELMSLKSSDIKNDIHNCFLECIRGLKDKEKLLIKKNNNIKNELNALQNDYDNLNPISNEEFNRLDKDSYLLHKDIKDYETIKNYLDIFKDEYQGYDNNLLNDLDIDPFTNKYSIGYYVEWFDGYDNNIRKINDISILLPKEIKRIIDLYKKYLLNVSIEYSRDGKNIEKEYLKDKYDFNLVDFDFYSEDSCELIISVDDTKIEYDNYLDILNNLENMINSLFSKSIKDLYSKEDVKQFECEVLKSYLNLDFSLNYILNNKDIDELYEYLIDHNYSSGIYEDEEEKVFEFLEKVNKMISEIKFLLDMINKRDNDIYSKNKAIDFYDKLYRRYSKQLKLEHSINENDEFIKSNSNEIIELDNLINYISEKINHFCNNVYVYKKS